MTGFLVDEGLGFHIYELMVDEIYTSDIDFKICEIVPQALENILKGFESEVDKNLED